MPYKPIGSEEPEDYPERSRIKPKKIYLACPYYHIDKNIRQARFEAVSRVASRLMQEGYIVFSPISHSHPIAQYMDDSHNTHETWLNQDGYFLEWCDELWVLPLEGWGKSFGVNWEIDKAQELKKPVKRKSEFVFGPLIRP